MFSLPFYIIIEVPGLIRLERVHIVLLLAYFTLISFTSSAQTVNFEDGFEDGNFSSNPTWSGDTLEFAVARGSYNKILQLQGDNENGGIAYLSTPSTNVTGSWEFFLELKEFSPSQGNRAEIFLMSDRSNLEGPVNGYALRAGENGSEDVFHIIRYDDGAEASVVLSGMRNISAGGDYRLRVSRQTGGIWKLESAQGYDGQLQSEGAEKIDNTHISSVFFGVKVTYSATRYNKFLFDFKIDLPPFSVEQIMPGEDFIEVQFNRAYDPLSVEAEDFFIDKGWGSPAAVTFPGPTIVRLYYGSDFTSDAYLMSISSINDAEGKPLVNSNNLAFTVFAQAEPGDVVINEIMYDPPLGIPEYVEILNRSKKYLNLLGWQLADQSGRGTIAFEKRPLQPSEILVLTPDTASLSNQFGKRNYLNVSAGNFPTFNNGGDAVRLFTGTGQIIDSLFYTPEWGGEDIALERRSSFAPSSKKANWGNSPEGIGTPGIPNLVVPDLEPPIFSEIKIPDPNTVLLLFNEELNPFTAANATNYSLEPNPGIQLISSANDSVYLSLTQSLQSLVTYRIGLSGLEDIFGNRIDNVSKDFIYVKTSPAHPGDLVINEIMFNPLEVPDDKQPDQSEYIEVRNTREYAISLEDIYLSNAPDENGDFRNLTPVNSATKWVPAQGIALFYADEEIEFEHSRLARFFNLDSSGNHSRLRIDRSTLSLAAENDAIYLRGLDGKTIDSVYYSVNWHNPNLPDTRGIALERISPTGPSNNATNWSSSSSLLGGTPGSENTIFQIAEHTPEQYGISFSPNPFSPDFDGIDDHLFINYRLDQPDYLIKVTIYDRYGRRVRRLANGLQAGIEGSLIWDGRKDNGTGNRIGLYIVVFEAFNSARGKGYAFKKTAVLARRLN